MTKLLFKLFINNWEDTSSAKVRENYGKLAGLVGIITNLIICIMKISLGIFQNSIAIIADGINNLSDAASSMITVIGFKLAAKEEDKDHPYGHARIEYLTGMVISMIIIFVGLQLFITSIEKVISPEPMDFSYLTVVVLVFSIIAKIWQSHFYKVASATIGSVALKAASTDSRNDVFATLSVLISLTVGYFLDIQLDGIMGCLVALFIIYSGVILIRETSSPLLGESPDEDLVNSIKTSSLSYSGVIGIHDLVVHNYGPGKIFASIHIEVDSQVDIMESHDLVDNIERNLSQELQIHLVAHMDPVLLNDPLTIKVYSEIESTIQGINGVESIHDLRVVPGPTHTNIIFDLVLSSSCELIEDEILAIIQERIEKINPTYNIVITFDKSYLSLE